MFHKPSWDLIHLFGETKGFKGIVACAKYNRDSHDSELGS